MKLKKRKHENLSETNLQKVVDLLARTPPVTKKEACEILNIAYNTSRLTRLLEDFESHKTYIAGRKAKNRGRPASNLEISEVVSYYLQGDTVAQIAKGLYRSPSFIKSIIDRVGVPSRRTKGEPNTLLPEECVAEDFEVGERVWSAQYDAPAQIDKRLEDSYTEKYDVPCYSIYVFQKVEQSNDNWIAGIEVGGFYAYQTAYEIGKLSHLEKYGVNLKEI